MFGYHTLGYILYYYDYITICAFCVDIFLGFSANISRYFLVKMTRSGGFEGECPGQPSRRQQKSRPPGTADGSGELQVQPSGCAEEDWAIYSAASSGMSSSSSSLPTSTFSGGFLKRISYRMGTIYRVIRVA